MDQGISKAHIAVIGAGGTGCALLPMLIASGPSLVRMVDGDMLEECNLERQPLYGPDDVGKHKAKAAANRLAHLCRNTRIEAISEFLHQGNAHDILASCTLVADCTDDLHARMLMDRLCADLRIPLVSGAVHGRQIQVLTLHTATTESEAGHGLRDWFPEPLHSSQSECDMRRVPAWVTTLAAARMAQRIQAVCNGDHSHAQLLDLIDAENGSWMQIRAPQGMDRYELIASADQEPKRGVNAIPPQPHTPYPRT